MVRRLDTRRLQRQLRAEWKTANRAGLFAILRRHARLNGGGDPVRCTPARWQIEAGTPDALQSAHKIIYDTLAAARACERELRANFGGPRQRAYECPRSRHGHVHLTRKWPHGS